MAVGLIYSDRFLEHRTSVGHPERPGRLRAIVECLREGGQWDRLTPLEFAAAVPEIAARLHSVEYINRARHACEVGADHLDSMDTPICPESFDLALLAVGGVVAAVNAVMAGEVDAAFCATRPPGHHAEKQMAMGFCLFGNIALAADHLIRDHGLERVAIVDFDVHHGNGTQHLLEDRGDILFASAHEHPKFQFPGTGYAHETGTGDGAGKTVNVPLLPGTGDDEARDAFEQTILPALDAFEPQFVLLSAGFDAHFKDPLGGLEWTNAGFIRIAQQLVDVAKRHAEGRIVSVLEGGYDLDALGSCASDHVGVLLDNMS